jgi:hypothetical protein
MREPEHSTRPPSLRLPAGRRTEADAFQSHAVRVVLCPGAYPDRRCSSVRTTLRLTTLTLPLLQPLSVLV